MYFATSLLLGASCLVALAHAQDNIAFTQVPASVQAGEPTTLEWAGGDDSVSSTDFPPLAKTALTRMGISRSPSR